MRFNPRLRAVLVVLALAVSQARPAAACIWNVDHYFMPFPPCRVDDTKTFARGAQYAAWTSGKLFTIGAKIRQVKMEVYMWQQSYNTARGWEQQLRDVYGDLTTNPLNSLAAEYNASSQFAMYIRAERGADGRFALKPIDVRSVADSIFTALRDSTDFRRIWGEAWSFGSNELNSLTHVNARLMDREMQALFDHRRVVRQVTDSLRAIGNRTASRYDGQGGTEGNAEAQISNMSATLSRLRGTAFEAQSEAIQARQRALSEARRTNENLERINTRTQVIMTLR
jgi:hypothetical protein